MLIVGVSALIFHRNFNSTIYCNVLVNRTGVIDEILRNGYTPKFRQKQSKTVRVRVTRTNKNKQEV